MSRSDYEEVRQAELAKSWKKANDFMVDRAKSYIEHVEPTTGNSEADPLGIAQHAPGAKLDAGKIRVGLVLGDFANALWAVSEIGTFGAEKYTPHGWLSVPNGIERYTDALDRHLLKESIEGPIDPESNKLHAAHLAWNALARLELIIRAEKITSRGEDH